MAAQSHTPFWRHDHISTSVTSAGPTGEPLGTSATVGPLTRTFAPEGGPDAQGESTLGYVFGWDTQDFAGGSLLDSSENELMKTFFDDPNKFTQYDFGMDQKHNPLANFNMDAQGDASPHPFNLNYLPTSGMAYGGNNDAQSQPPGHRGADVSAASSLMNMSSQHQSPDMPNGAAWANTQPSAPGVMVPADEANHDMSHTDRLRYATGMNPHARPVAFTPELLSARLGVPADGLDPSSSAPSHATMYGHMTNLSHQNYLTQPHPADSLTQIAVTARQHPFTFGSDQDFSSQGYQGMGSSLQRDKVYNLLNLPLASQAAGHDGRFPSGTGPFPGPNSGPPSPGPRRPSHLTSPGGIEIPTFSQWEASKRRQSHYTAGEDDDGADETKRARKRRKSNDGDGRRMSRIDIDGERTSSTPMQRGQGSPPGSPGSSPGAEGSSSQRRKTRTNLTETQKRENHIMSEQKRRNVIKQAFNDLNMMVPNLQKGKSGLSKAEILKEVVTFIEATINGNKCMEELLSKGDGINHT